MKYMSILISFLLYSVFSADVHHPGRKVLAGEFFAEFHGVDFTYSGDDYCYSAVAVIGDTTNTSITTMTYIQARIYKYVEGSYYLLAASNTTNPQIMIDSDYMFNNPFRLIPNNQYRIGLKIAYNGPSPTSVNNTNFSIPNSNYSRLDTNFEGDMWSDNSFESLMLDFKLGSGDMCNCAGNNRNCTDTCNCEPTTGYTLLIANVVTPTTDDCISPYMISNILVSLPTPVTCTIYELDGLGNANSILNSTTQFTGTDSSFISCFFPNYVHLNINVTYAIGLLFNFNTSDAIATVNVDSYNPYLLSYLYSINTPISGNGQNFNNYVNSSLSISMMYYEESCACSNSFCNISCGCNCPNNNFDLTCYDCKPQFYGTNCSNSCTNCSNIYPNSSSYCLPGINGFCTINETIFFGNFYNVTQNTCLSSIFASLNNSVIQNVEAQFIIYSYNGINSTLLYNISILSTYLYDSTSLSVDISPYRLVPGNYIMGFAITYPKVYALGLPYGDSNFDSSTAVYGTEITDFMVESSIVPGSISGVYEITFGEDLCSLCPSSCSSNCDCPTVLYGDVYTFTSDVCLSYLQTTIEGPIENACIYQYTNITSLNQSAPIATSLIGGVYFSSPVYLSNGSSYMLVVNSSSSPIYKYSAANTIYIISYIIDSLSPILNYTSTNTSFGISYYSMPCCNTEFVGYCDSSCQCVCYNNTFSPPWCLYPIHSSTTDFTSSSKHHNSSHSHNNSSHSNLSHMLESSTIGKGDGLSAGAIAGIVIGSVAAAGVVVGGASLCSSKMGYGSFFGINRVIKFCKNCVLGSRDDKNLKQKYKKKVESELDSFQTKGNL